MATYTAVEGMKREFNRDGKGVEKKRREGGKKPRRKIKPRNFNDTVDAGGWPGWKFPCFDK